MQNLVANGVPVFTPNGYASGWMRTSSASDSLHVFRTLSIWAQQKMGWPLDHQLVDLLAFLAQHGLTPESSSVQAIANATALPIPEIETRLRALHSAQLLDLVDDADLDAGIRIKPALLSAWLALQEQLDHAFIARPALRQALLLNRCSGAALAQAVEQTFDTFFDLGWLYLHNWGANCYLMASLVAAAMRVHGHQARVASGTIECLHQGRTFYVGAKGLAQTGQIDGHAFCIVDDKIVVDFGLGAARRVYRRDFFWAIAADVSHEPDVAMRVEHERLGRLSWHTPWQSPAGAEQLRNVAPLVAQLMAVYHQQRPVAKAQ